MFLPVLSIEYLYQPISLNKTTETIYFLTSRFNLCTRVIWTEFEKVDSNGFATTVLFLPLFLYKRLLLKLMGEGYGRECPSPRLGGLHTQPHPLILFFHML